MYTCTSVNPRFIIIYKSGVYYTDSDMFSWWMFQCTAALGAGTSENTGNTGTTETFSFFNLKS